MFDNFVAELRCPNCGMVIPATANIGLQTHLRGDADGSELGVKYSFAPVDLTVDHILARGYALIVPPAVAGPIRLLDIWSCPACETEQWAMIEIANGRIEKINGVQLTRTTLERANFISAVSADILAESLMGFLPLELTKRQLNAIDILRQRLE